MYLNEHGALAPGGRPQWTVYGVRSILFSPVHAGLVRLLDGGEDEPECIQARHFDKRHYDPEDYHSIMRRKERASRRRGPGAANSLFLSGTLRCGECGRSLGGRY